MKKFLSIVKIPVTIYLGYLLICVTLALFGFITVIPLAPGGWKIKTPSYVDEMDKKTPEFEQPIVIYNQDSATIYSTEIQADSLIRKVQSIDAKENFSIQVIYNNSQFEVPIRKDFAIEKSAFEMPEKLIAISDIEGNFEAFSNFLKGTGVINSQYKWTYGNGHLVLLGDFFDRGKYVNECLWLIYKLEEEAKQAGGKVHFILGNHEVMNLIGAYNDKAFKYVNGKFWANAEILDLEYKKWYLPNTELGRWLRSKNTIEKIGDILFVHGGLSPDMFTQNYSINQINEIVRNGIDKNMEDHSLIEQLVLRNKGPLWYRGLAKEEIEESVLDQILLKYNGQKVIIGHSIVDEISTFYHNKVIDIDLHHSDNDLTTGLMISKSGYFVIDSIGETQKLL
ncbi:metallophosphoesterase [Chondrinema litorale]|uniref:metallophosphoesterase n=1 Tax=Chondrinema litorale TaxID=2994555 RepID=UPI002542DE28|nr:metallophosphoesterase [Chondrinema litorale]UZR97910.1 metallophosphoesterase [Chondrinema litorale]